MPANEGQDGIRIGEGLRRARTRQQLDIKAVEDRTKIRARYLRALENEEWDILPAPAYVRGFLRTYAQILGLDADAFVDEYERQAGAGAGAEAHYQLAEPVLERRLRATDRERSWLRRGPAIAALVVAVGAVLLILGLTGGGGGTQGHRAGHGKQAQGRNHHAGTTTTTPALTPITLALKPLQTVQACLVRASGVPQIDSQVLPAGVQQPPQGTFPAAESFRLDLATGGTIVVLVNGKAQTLRHAGPVTYNISSQGIHATGYQGPSCP